MKYYVICDYRENFKNYSLSPLNLYSDHPTRKNITEIIEALHELGYDCEFFGGIPELNHVYFLILQMAWNKITVVYKLPSC